MQEFYKEAARRTKTPDMDRYIDSMAERDEARMAVYEKSFLELREVLLTNETQQRI